MTETDQLNRMRGVGQGEESPGRPPGRPMRQLEFSQAMSDFCYMFPETDEEVIEAVLRANNGMVDATIDQLLTMNIDADINDDDDLSDKILQTLERDLQQQQMQPSHMSQINAAGLPVHQVGSRRSGRESKTSSRKSASGETAEKSLVSKDSEDCPPSYTEAVQSHLSHHHRSNGSRSRHRHSPTIGSAHPSRQALSNMQHLLDLGPDTAPAATATVNGGISSKSHPRDHTWSPSSGHHHHHHFPRTSASSHHRRRWAGVETSNGEKSGRPGRNLLASSGGHHHHHHHHHVSPHHHHHEPATGDREECGPKTQHRKGSLDSNDFFPPTSSLSHTDNGYGGKSHEKSPHRWRLSQRGEFTNPKRPAFRNWNPPLLGTLPDDFLRIVPSASLPSRPSRHGTHLHRTMSAVGTETRHLNSTSMSLEAAGGNSAGHHSKFKSSSSQKPHRSLSFAGNTAQGRGGQHEFSPDLLQERMKENERRRRMTSIDLDPALAMYLEDERLALMLQNSEFLQELRGDRMFMLTLERDQKSGDLERLKRESSPEALQPGSFEDDSRDFIEGYGDDRQNTLEAFPFSQQLPPPVSEDVELRKKLKNMGKASRKQFAALARKFFMKRRKKTAQQILRGTQAPSTLNLLDEDEDDIEEESRAANNDHGSDSYNQVSNTQDEPAMNLSSSPQTRRHFDVV
ncbi:hypothetical protein RRG08_042246 [Elysia crispata]|uniref:CUE domain-containing protein n=1 Tax=Elysia crispata TaxID=231223 RepID=A0AAE1E3Q6_9GAST|nr:hypothetical protein RRG08_042246 [Elysia crispata]